MPPTVTMAATLCGEPYSRDQLALGKCCIGRHSKRAPDKHLLSTYDVLGP